MNPKVFLDMAKTLGGGKGNVVELPTPQGWYDRLLNAINRLGRPLLLVATILFFMWGINDPEHFVVVMKAFAETPDWITTAVLMSIGLFGTGRIISDVKKKDTLKQQIAETPVGEPKEEPTESQTVDLNKDRKFANLDDDNPEVIEDGEDIVNAEPENDAIEAWKAKNATS